MNLVDLAGFRARLFFVLWPGCAPFLAFPGRKRLVGWLAGCASREKCTTNSGYVFVVYECVLCEPPFFR